VGSGKSVAGFFHESVLSCAGQVWLSGPFLCALYRLVRAAGGLCVADEVQTGLWRCGGGAACWAWQPLLQPAGLEPDVLTAGKGLGNGFPLAATLCTQAVADSFANGLEYFNSTGGSNAAVAAGTAVLDVLRGERLQDHARSIGVYWLARLRKLARRCELIHDVRGQGLFLGIEIRLPVEGVCRPAGVADAGDSALDGARRTPQLRLEQLPRAALPRCAHRFGNLTQEQVTVPTAAAPLAPLPASCPCAGCASLSAGAVCDWLVSALLLLRPLGVLVGSDGPLHNVLKLKPPMPFTRRDADYFVDGLSLTLRTLRELQTCCFRSKLGGRAAEDIAPRSPGQEGAELWSVPLSKL